MTQLLVIDDDDALRRTMRSFLISQGHRAAEASSGEEGLRIARSLHPDLILSDLCMANGDGYSLLWELARTPDTASIPIIIMTGQGDADELRHAMELGADDFLLKPFSDETLLATVKARLKRHESMRQQASNSYSRLVAILDATPDLVAILDGSYDKVIYLNHAGRTILGRCLPEDSVTLTSAMIHPPEALEILRQNALPSAIATGVSAAETLFCDSQGKPIPFSQVILAQKNDDGHVECLATVARDIRAEKAAQKERDRMEVQLRQAQKLESIGQLAAGIAHEINTPTQYIGDNIRFLETAFKDLASLVSQYDQMLETAQKATANIELTGRATEAKKNADLDYLTAEVPKAIQQSLDGVERVAKIVRSMKEFSHPGSHTKTPTDINRAIDSTLTVARNEWKYVANLEIDFDKSLPLVPCLPGEFNQVILNLV